MWRTYVMLTDLEAVFRSLKSELGLRPIFHSKQARSDAHLFISVLAYQFVQIIRTRLADRGIDHSWATLREILRVQRRTTSRFNTRGGRTLSVRKASQPEADSPSSTARSLSTPIRGEPRSSSPESLPTRM
jgi:transposase